MQGPPREQRALRGRPSSGWLVITHERCDEEGSETEGGSRHPADGQATAVPAHGRTSPGRSSRARAPRTARIAAATGGTQSALRGGRCGRCLLADAVAHRPDVASLIVGVNDVMRSSWDTVRLRDDLMTCADALAGQGALLMTARFHDHSVMWPMPGWMKRSIQRRTADLNAIWDEAHATYGGLRLDLGAVPDLHERRFWAADRLHPSELGHRRMARAFGEQLVSHGFTFEPPSLEPSGGLPTSWRQDLAWMAGEGVPWLGRRAREGGPSVVGGGGGCGAGGGGGG
ncbi:GDSL-type esterase/lipase family protein, partial [Streptomyces sp. NPDC049954]|uniref:GDSL-type esterase/lipase family protein n=1 Tax=Streptomyces sp. NPDC049954 TaxID=3155779 RepID=UPI00344551B7